MLVTYYLACYLAIITFVLSQGTRVLPGAYRLWFVCFLMVGWSILSQLLYKVLQMPHCFYEIIQLSSCFVVLWYFPMHLKKEAAQLVLVTSTGLHYRSCHVF